MIDDGELARLVHELRTAGMDMQNVEVKSAVGKLPKSIAESISALANGTGGIIILGLAEGEGFRPAAGFDAHASFDALATVCADKLVTPVRPSMRIAQVEGAPVVVASIPEAALTDKPCYVADRGMYRGSFVRTGDGDRLLSHYEIDRLLEERRQPCHDLEVVEGATLADLDANLVGSVLRRQRDLHPRVFAQFSDEEALRALGIASVAPDGATSPTLAGLLALGRYPQHFFPRLTVAFACYPGTEKASVSGVKFIDSRTMAGSVPAVLVDTVAAVRRNMRIGGAMDGIVRRDVPDYPDVVVREAVCNALMHRDYSPLGRGSAVQVEMYADRLEVISPGGLYGAATIETLGEAGVSSTRNQRLSTLLESVPYEGGYVAENRGTGFALMQHELAAVGSPSLEVYDSLSHFRLVIRRNDSLGSRCEDDGAGQTAKNCRDGGGSGEDAVLGCIERLGEARTSDIARETGMPRSTVSYRLRKLHNEGFIEVVEKEASATSPQRAYRVANAGDGA